MPRFAYAWHAITDHWELRAAIEPTSPQPPGVCALTEDEARLALRSLDDRCPPPWWVVGEMTAESWEEVAHRVRTWHFT